MYIIYEYEKSVVRIKTYILSYDLGTGGIKASLYDAHGKSLTSSFVAYSTYYPFTGWHEQRPMDWWNAVKESTHKLLSNYPVETNKIACISISGHSLGVVPIGKDYTLLREFTPIWSDSRAQRQASEFFSSIDETQWYMSTGNGFPPHLYSVFKMMWYRDNEPEMFKKINKVIGTKDFVNFMMTGVVCTDFSYASGSGVYDLKNWKYREDYIKASGLSRSLFPEIVESSQVIGTLTEDAAKAMGLPKTVRVVCGGVDNACMAAGAKGIQDGRAYTSLGSSAWIAMTSHEPIVNAKKRPYVFAHCIPGMFASATSIFAAGSSFKWVRDNICKDMLLDAADNGLDVYDLMTRAAAKSPVGANKLLFNPSLAGGSGCDHSPNIRGGYIGLDLRHTQDDLIRSAMEGIAMNLKTVMDVLCEYIKLSDYMLIVGGGGKSRLWRQIFADVYNVGIVESNVGQDAGSLGAAACAAVGIGLWKDFSFIDSIHETKEIIYPDPIRSAEYQKIIEVFKISAQYQSEIGDRLAKIE